LLLIGGTLGVVGYALIYNGMWKIALESITDPNELAKAAKLGRIGFWQPIAFVPSLIPTSEPKTITGPSKPHGFGPGAAKHRRRARRAANPVVAL